MSACPVLCTWSWCLRLCLPLGQSRCVYLRQSLLLRMRLRMGMRLCVCMRATPKRRTRTHAQCYWAMLKAAEICERWLHDAACSLDYWGQAWRLDPPRADAPFYIGQVCAACVCMRRWSTPTARRRSRQHAARSCAPCSVCRVCRRDA